MIDDSYREAKPEAFLYKANNGVLTTVSLKTSNKRATPVYHNKPHEGHDWTSKEVKIPDKRIKMISMQTTSDGLSLTSIEFYDEQDNIMA